MSLTAAFAFEFADVFDTALPAVARTRDFADNGRALFPAPRLAPRTEGMPLPRALPRADAPPRKGAEPGAAFPFVFDCADDPAAEAEEAEPRARALIDARSVMRGADVEADADTAGPEMAASDPPLGIVESEPCAANKCVGCDE